MLKGNAIKKRGFRSIFSGLVPLFALAHFVHHLVNALPIPLLPMIRSEFALDYTQSGLLISAFNLSYGISQLPAGWLTDRIGSRILITIGICGVALAGFLVGLSQTYVMVIVFLVLMGILGGGYHPASPPLISASVKPNKRGQALGFHMVGSSASFFLAPLIAPALATIWGWRGAFIGLSIPTLAFGITFYILLRRRTGKKTTQQMITDHQNKIVPPPGRLRRLISVIILSTFTQAVIFSTVTFIPLFMVDLFGVNERAAAAFLSIIYSGGLWASLLGGYLSDRLGRVPVIIAASLLTGPIIYLLNPIPYGWGMGALLVAMGLVMYVRLPVTEAYVVGQSSDRNRSTMLGFYYFGGMVGGSILTTAMGSLIDRFGFYTSFTIAGATLTAVALICSVFLWSTRDKSMQTKKRTL